MTMFPNHSSVLLLKFVVDAILEGLVSNSDDSEYCHQVNRMKSCCGNNDLQLNVSKIREIIVYFRKRNTRLAPLIINSDCIENMECLSILGTIIYSDLVWENNREAVVKKGQERPFFLRQLKKFDLKR